MESTDTWILRFDRNDKQKGSPREREGAGQAEAGNLPHVEGGVGDFGGEGFGEEGERLIFALELAAVGEGFALHFHGAVFEEGFAFAAGAEGAERREGEVEFARESGVAFADGEDIAAVGRDGDGEGGVGGVGGVDEGDAGVAGEGFAELGAHEGAGLGEEGFVFHGLKVERVEGEFPRGAGAELVVGAAGAKEREDEGPEAKGEGTEHG